MTRQERAQDLLDELALPEGAPEILAHPKYWNVDFCRLYLERCEGTRFEDPRAGLGLAEIAPSLAFLVPRHQCGGERGWCSLQVDALGVCGSAHRAVGDFELAEETFLVAMQLFIDQAEASVCAGIMVRMAYLRASQQRFGEAGDLADEAIGIFQRRGEDHRLGCALIDRGAVFIRAQRFDLAARDLLEALDLLEEGRDPRYHYAAVHNLSYALLNLESVDPGEALGWLRRARELCRGGEASLSWAKLLWVEVRPLVLAGRTREAQEALETVRHRLLELGAVFDAALATIQLAQILFETGETARVKELAGELFPLFRVLRADDDAYDVLRLFQRAALSETLNAEVFRRVEEGLRTRALAFVEG